MVVALAASSSQICGDHGPNVGQAIADAIGVGSGFVIEAPSHGYGAVEHETVLVFHRRILLLMRILLMHFSAAAEKLSTSRNNLVREWGSRDRGIS
jgi:hypothetical protein